MLAAGPLLHAAEPRSPVHLTRIPLSVGAGRTIRLLAAGSRLWVACTVQTHGGYDLLLSEWNVKRNSLGRTIRLNPTPGEVQDASENSHRLAVSPDQKVIHACWVGSDPRRHLANRLRLTSIAVDGGHPATTTVNDDSLPSTHSFHDMAIGPNGHIHIAWLDRRHNELGGATDYPGGGLISGSAEMEASLYYAHSEDAGRTVTANRMLARSACACCRVSLAANGPTLTVAWRNVSAESIRDIMLRRSADAGSTWSQGTLLWADRWKLNACPHNGAALFALDEETISAVWWTAGRKPALYWAVGRLPFATTYDVSHGLRQCGGATWVKCAGKTMLLFHGADSAGHSQLHVVVAGVGGRPGGTFPMPLRGGSVRYPTAVSFDRGIALGWSERRKDATLLWAALADVS